jgi:hypothetical protein
MNRCPHCRETLGVLSKEPLCPHCGRTIRTEEGAKVRQIDLDGDKILAAADERAQTWMKHGAIYAGVVGLLTIVPPLIPVAYVLLVVGQFFFARFGVASPYAAHFGGMRKLVARWMSRLALTWLVAVAHAAVLIPGLAIVTAPIVFWLTLLGVKTYFRFHFRRERERQGILAVEVVLLVVMAVVLLASGCVLGLVLYGVLR